MNFPDLDNADVRDIELNKLAYDPSAFPGLQEMLNSRQFNSPKFQTIDLTALSVNGIIKQDPMAEYLAKKANSSSALKEVLKTPFHYLFYTQQKQQVPEKPHFELGTFAHMAFIEPDAFDKYIIEPDGNMAKKEDVMTLIRFYEKTNGNALSGIGHLGADPKINDLKNYLTTLKEKCPYKVVAKEYQEIIDVLGYSYKHYGDGIIPRILKGAISEASFYTKDPETGLSVKVRPDFFNIEENIGVNAIISFKTTSAGTVEKFLYDTAKFKYELSEGMYQDVVSHVTARKFNVTIMIMLQTVPPYLPAVFWWGPEDLTNGKYKYRTAINQVKECQEKSLYPGFDARAENGNYGIIELIQPEWAKKDLHPVDIED
jgi:hypothetical protein